MACYEYIANFYVNLAKSDEMCYNVYVNQARRQKMHILSAGYSDIMVGYSKHDHDAHELLYVVSGEIAVRIGDEEYVGRPGSLLIFSRFEEHSVRVLTKEYRRYTLLISPDISRGAENYLLSSVLINRFRGFRHVIDCRMSDSEIEQVMKMMAEEYSRREPMYERLLDSMLMRLLIIIYRISPELFLTDENRNTEIVRDIQSRFEREFAEHYTLSSLASEYHVSSSHLAHAFKEITGYSPIEYLISCRLSAAKTLLAKSNKSIKEIIDLCGFSDESNFSRMFHSRVGCTPSNFRRQNYSKSLDK